MRPTPFRLPSDTEVYFLLEVLVEVGIEKQKRF